MRPETWRDNAELKAAIDMARDGAIGHGHWLSQGASWLVQGPNQAKLVEKLVASTVVWTVAWMVSKLADH